MIHFLLSLPHVDFAVSGLSFLVYVLLINKTRSGYVVGFLNQGLWTLFMFQTRQFGLVGSISLFAVVNVYGFWAWTRNPPVRGKADPVRHCDRCATVLATQEAQAEAT